MALRQRGAKGTTFHVNIEDRSWEKGEAYAPVITQTQVYLIVSMALSNKWVLKQADCHNAFCHGVLPEDEVVIVCPPAGCPVSKPGTSGNSTRHFMVFIAPPFIGSTASQQHSKQ
eukprot:15365589-Ditylum_brightwellii.AAC.2